MKPLSQPIKTLITERENVCNKALSQSNSSPYEKARKLQLERRGFLNNKIREKLEKLFLIVYLFLQ